MKKIYPILVLVVLSLAWLYGVNALAPEVLQKPTIAGNAQNPAKQNDDGISRSVELPAVWGDLGARMIEAGVIDRTQFEALYAGRGGLTDAEKQFLYGRVDGNIVVTQENSNFILNLLWALGLGNKNVILEKGDMVNPQYGGAGRFASTGGWSLAKGDAMDHYSAHPFITLAQEEQKLVERISGNIYRPCCNNPAIFPDCNHGMAMLGLLELLASQGASEEQMYAAALEMNRFWFPEQYAMIDQYLASKNRAPGEASPKEILGKEYSSASGFGRIASELKGTPQGGGSCGV